MKGLSFNEMEIVVVGHEPQRDHHQARWLPDRLDGDPAGGEIAQCREQSSF